MIPSPVSGWPNCAVSEATIRSQAIASSLPPPRQKPDTAATSGVRTRRIASQRSIGAPRTSPSRSPPPSGRCRPRGEGALRASSTMQRICSSSSSATSASTSSPMTSSLSAFSASGRLSRTTAIGGSRSTRTTLTPSPGTSRRRLRLVGRHRERQPVARVVDGLVPGEVAPEVQLLLRVAHGLRELGGELLDQLVDGRVEVRRRTARFTSPHSSAFRAGISSQRRMISRVDGRRP